MGFASRDDNIKNAENQGEIRYDIITNDRY